VLCAVKNECELFKASKKISSKSINFASFREPDLDNQLTAIATEPVRGETRKVFKDFQLIKENLNGT